MRIVSLGLFLCISSTLWGQDTPVPMVRFHTNLGDIDVTLLPNAAPLNVANFLKYVTKGSYTNSVIHRSVPGFVIQGGGFTVPSSGLPPAIPADPAVANEFKVSNQRGTLAMALVGSDANSATTQWFFNELDNSANLDVQNGGFTVIGRIDSAASLAILDKIAAVPVPIPGPLSSPFDQIPLLNYSGGTPGVSNYVTVLSISQLLPFPAIAQNGVISAGNFGGYPAASAGSFLEIYGTNLAATTRGWGSGDFTGGNAPTSLDGVSVTVAGKAAYVNYVSPTQVNVQIPAGVPTDGLAAVVLTYSGEVSGTVNLPMRPYEGGLLAPASFKVGDVQYVEAFHASGAYVSNGTVAGIPNAPAVAGEMVVFYGVGFGAVTPGSTPVAGQIVTQSTTLATPVTFSIGGMTAAVSYQGLVQGLVGLYQFNVTVPAGVAAGDAAVKVGQGVQVVPQTLFLPVAGN